MVKNEIIVKLLKEAGCVPYFKEICVDKSIELVVHPNLLKFLKESGITDNKLINRLLGPSKVKAAYFDNKHPNFISLFKQDGEIMLRYINFDFLIKIVKKECHSRRVTETDIEGGFRPMIITIIKRLCLKGYSPSYQSIGSFIERIENVETIKLGRGINKLFNKTDPKDVEQFVDLIKKAQLADESHDMIEVVTGQEIQFYYNENQYDVRSSKSSSIFALAMEQYVGGCGELNNSCMKYQNCSRGIKFYAANPETISLLIYKSNESPTKIKGRAILWKGIDGNTYIDRIYGINNNITLSIASYAHNNKFINCSSSNRKILPYTPTNVVRVQLQRWQEMELPFFDSLKYINLQKGVISNWVYNDEDNFIHGGHTFGDNYTQRFIKIKCCVTGDEVYEHDTVTLTYGKYKGQHCKQDESAYIKYSNKYLTLNEITEDDFVVGTSNLGDTIIPKVDAIKDFKDEYIPMSQAIYFPTMDVYTLCIQDIFKGKQVIISDTLLNDCIREDIDYNHDIKELIGNIYKCTDFCDKGVYISHSKKIFLIPFQSLKLK